MIPPRVRSPSRKQSASPGSKSSIRHRDCFPREAMDLHPLHLFTPHPSFEKHLLTRRYPLRQPPMSNRRIPFPIPMRPFSIGSAHTVNRDPQRIAAICTAYGVTMLSNSRQPAPGFDDARQQASHQTAASDFCCHHVSLTFPLAQTHYHIRDDPRGPSIAPFVQGTKDPRLQATSVL